MISFNIDLSDLQDLLSIEEVANKELQNAARDLTEMTKAKITEIANEKLHTRRKTFLDGLSTFQVDDNTWIINLDAKARWIDDGMEPHSMVQDLLKSKNAKTAADGSKYAVIPFQHNKTKQQQTPAQQSLLATIKKELAKVGATPNRLETDKAGKPKLGLVRSLDITQAPLSTGALKIGAGPRGQVAQGPTGTPILKGVKIYQKELPTGKVGRFVMTFRVVSSKHEAEGRWFHPGLEATHIMEDGLKWAMEQWENKIGPGIAEKIISSIS
jgi:hypothetical protein